MCVLCLCSSLTLLYPLICYGLLSVLTLCVFLSSIWALIWKSFMGGLCMMMTAVR